MDLFNKEKISAAITNDENLIEYVSLFLDSILDYERKLVVEFILTRLYQRELRKNLSVSSEIDRDGDLTCKGHKAGITTVDNLPVDNSLVEAGTLHSSYCPKCQTTNCIITTKEEDRYYCQTCKQNLTDYDFFVLRE